MFGNERLCRVGLRSDKMRCKKYGSRPLKEPIANWQKLGSARTVGRGGSQLRSLARLYKARFWNSCPHEIKRLKLWVREQGIDKPEPSFHSLFFGRSKAFCIYLRASCNAPKVSSLVWTACRYSLMARSRWPVMSKILPN